MTDPPRMLPVAQIRPSGVGDGNERKKFDPVRLKALAALIARDGLQQPIRVRPCAPDADGRRFEIIMGERRFRAVSQVNGEREIMAFVDDVDDAALVLRRIGENMGREDLSPMEQARGFTAALDVPGVTLETLIEASNETRGYVLDMLALVDLCPSVAATVTGKPGGFPLEHAHILAGAGLTHHNQRAAFDAYGRNDAPTGEWWARLCADMAGAQNQQELFAFGDSLVLKVQQEAMRAIERAKPRPGVDAPRHEFADVFSRATCERAYWADAADAWDDAGRPNMAARCREYADLLARVLDGVAAPPERPARTCADCPLDIRHLHGNADRCPTCQTRHRAACERQRHERRTATPALL